MDGWMDGWIGWIAKIDRWMDGWIDRPDRWMDGWMDG
jgi:hypothetical protein